MKKLLALLINYFNPNYFPKMSYGNLEKWGITDAYNGKIYFKMSNCPECKSEDVRVAIHTDYKECNKCFHFWEESDKTKER